MVYACYLELTEIDGVLSFSLSGILTVRVTSELCQIEAIMRNKNDMTPEDVQKLRDNANMHAAVDAKVCNQKRHIALVMTKRNSSAKCFVRKFLTKRL